MLIAVFSNAHRNMYVFGIIADSLTDEDYVVFCAPGVKGEEGGIYWSCAWDRDGDFEMCDQYILLIRVEE